ncbi:unnamed protein product [Nesidiocoris tenuis]|uniref:Uncharacterized protein n=1 Tax=Nesidiocoris tenuis TaxID=355587 RepID=A0A6H5HNT8_9HEMI|nr:unnamed protein product [Nesidiocoris tenuis]
MFFGARSACVSRSVQATPGGPLGGSIERAAAQVRPGRAANCRSILLLRRSRLRPFNEITGGAVESPFDDSIETRLSSVTRE